MAAKLILPRSREGMEKPPDEASARSPPARGTMGNEDIAAETVSTRRGDEWGCATRSKTSEMEQQTTTNTSGADAHTIAL